MRQIKPTTQFKKDHKREQKGLHKQKVQGSNCKLMSVVQLLACDELLPPKYHDHQLTGTYADCRDCHIAPDLILIYQLVGKDALLLIRLGSHSELF
ncbi:MAG: mRNA interferase YafQ [Pseudomonadota bacterium]|nr:mRNA interferase YafQ [Pseudomonadota bacterium]